MQVKRTAVTAAAMLALAMGGLALPARFSWVTSIHAAPTTAPVGNAKNTEVPVKVVALFSSGVGYFEHEGSVQGTGSTELRFKINQINDILKSLMLQASGDGKISSVDYPSQDPIEKTLHSFQVDITGNPPLATMLQQLRGAQVKLTLVGAESTSGTILGTEQKTRPVGEKGQPVTSWYLNLIADGSIESVELDRVQRVHLEDPQLQAELNKALSTLAQARDQDKKPVTIHFQGTGDMRLRIGYVMETPIWKTSYRLVMTDKPAVRAQPSTAPTTGPSALRDGKLQGWAIVENETDNDWNNVQLSLVSGRPISFIQNLYQPLYIPRPVVEPELFASLTPQTYDNGSIANRIVNPPGQVPPGEFQLRMSQTPNHYEPGTLTQNSFGGKTGEAGKSSSNAPAPGLPANASGDAMDIAASVTSLATSGQMGELFQYTLDSVSLPRQRSAMFPIVTEDVEIQKVSIYNQKIMARHALNGARVHNTTGKHLLQGPITVLDGNGYAGDARIDDVPPGQSRLIRYGVDLQMVVDAPQNDTKSTIQTIKISNGMLRVERRQEMSQVYKADNRGDTDRVLLIEHPVHPGWDLKVENEKSVETTSTLHRIKGTVHAHEKTTVVVKEQRLDEEVSRLVSTSMDALEVYRTNSATPESVKQVLAKAAALKTIVNNTEHEIATRTARIADINNEQARLRQNINTVDRNTTYHSRLLTKLDNQETELEKLQGESDGLRQKLEQQRLDLQNYLENLTVE